MMQLGDRAKKMKRRSFLQAACLSSALPLLAKAGVRVGAHLWMFAAKQPGYDATPVLEDVFRQYSTAGLDGIELMHQILLHEDAVQRVGELSSRYKLPVIGTSSRRRCGTGKSTSRSPTTPRR